MIYIPKANIFQYLLLIVIFYRICTLLFDIMISLCQVYIPICVHAPIKSILPFSNIVPEISSMYQKGVTCCINAFNTRAFIRVTFCFGRAQDTFAKEHLEDHQMNSPELNLNPGYYQLNKYKVMIVYIVTECLICYSRM